jgi:hypothetical protein
MGTRSRLRLLLVLSLGLWIGGSIVIWGVATYNFAGVANTLERNTKLAERAGFEPGDTVAMKQSVLWVHSSELNRWYFETWGYAQIGVAAVALVLAILARSKAWITCLVLIALGLAVYSALYLTPEIVGVGRSLDFVPREPPPETLPRFGRLHGISLAVDFGRGLLLIVAALGLIASGHSSGDNAE